MVLANGTETSLGFVLKRIDPSDEGKLNELTAFVKNHKYPSPFQSGSMVNVYSKTKGCEPIALTAVDQAGRIIASIVATVFFDAGVVIGKLVSHVVCRGGPLFLPTRVGSLAGDVLLAKFIESAKRESLYTRVYPLFDNKDQIALLSHQGFSRENWLNYTIDLTMGEKAVWNSISKHRRKGIRRADQLGLDVADVSSLKDIDTAYSLIFESHKSAMIPLQDRSLFENLYRIMVPNGQSKIVIAYLDGRPLACRVLLTFSDIIYDWYAGSTKVGNEASANEFLVWHMLEWGCRLGYRLFDFGGAGKPDEEYGPREFKRRFHGNLTNLGRYTMVHRPKTLKLLEEMHRLRRRI